MSDLPPILLVGAGAAGISAAGWLDSLHQPFVWVSPDVGGILQRVSNRITNLPPSIFSNGSELTRKLELYIKDLGKTPSRLALEDLEISRSTFKTTFDDGSSNTFDSVILATGTRYRTLGIEGESTGLDEGWVSQSSARDADRFAKERVAVIGGGDAAYENALRLAAVGCEVTLIRRSSPRARAAFVDEVDSHDSIAVHAEANATRFTRTDGRTRIELDDGSSLEVSGVFVRIGVETVLPNFIGDEPALEDGRVVVDIRQQTSVPGLFAAGDLTIIEPQGIGSAIGQGAIAARSATSLVA